MSSLLSRIERELLIKYIATEKPELVLKNSFETSDSVSVVFEPLSLTSDSYFVQGENIVIPRKPHSRVLADGAEVLVSFFYKGRAMFFDSTFRHAKSDFIVPINDQLFKLLEQNNGIYEYLTCIISPLNDSDSGTENLFSRKCIVNENFLIFRSGDELKSVQKFFAFDFESGNQIQNRVLPPIILYICEKFILIGSQNEYSKFEKDYVYQLEISIPQVFITRKIICKANCSQVFNDDESFRKCFKFEFIDLKPEDKRFIYEKLYGKKYNQ